MSEVVASSEDGMVVEGMEEREKKRDGSADLVRWESFLPRMVLRVLLVEADDSTRQIIAALLRKCSYRVAAVPDGLKAWETLKEQPQNIDLILTEVELPLISGYALLTLIMEHEVCKNIPVIMMSSHDSISMVLKCMLKGAADFLIKPVRRNELRNLWQHVWRKQTTVGNAQENTAAAQNKIEASAENNAASNHSSSNLASPQKNKECSEKVSDTQSSCTTRYLEAESAYMQNMQGLSQLKCESTSNLSNTEEHEECMRLNESPVMLQTVGRGHMIRLGPEGGSCKEVHDSTVFKSGEDHVDQRMVNRDASMGPKSCRENANVAVEIHYHADELVEPSNGAIDLIGKFENSRRDAYEHPIAKDGMTKFAFAPQLELSLRRFQPSCSKNEGTDEKHTLNHSNASAFSRYINSKASQPVLPSVASTCTEPKEYVCTFQNQSSSKLSENVGTSRWHGTALSNGQENMSTSIVGQSGQGEAAFPSPQLGLLPVQGVRFDNLRTGYGQILPPILYAQSGFPPAWSPKSSGHQDLSPLSINSSLHSSSEVHSSEQGYRTFDGMTNHSGGQTIGEENNMESMEVTRHVSPARGLTFSGVLHNGAASKLNNAVCGSICNPSDLDATSVAAVARTTGSESVNDDHVIVTDGLRGMDSHCSTQREAALLKFRLKRKERCYEKKVRYQSRKRLAEQRPRVKGQFVRQLLSDLAPVDAGGSL